MRRIHRVIDSLKLPSVDPEKRDARYRCLRCGEGYERNHHSCPTCGARYVVPTEGASADED